MPDTRPSRWKLQRSLWRTMRRGPAAIESVQQARFQELVSFTRAHSPFYQRHYQGVPAEVKDARELPPVTKSELMANFDDWVTDPEVTWAEVEAFVADKTLVGHQFLDRYSVWRSSGSTGVRGVFLHDEHARRVFSALISMRGVLAPLGLRDLLAFLRGGRRVARVAFTGDHYSIPSLVARRHLEGRERADRGRIFSERTPPLQLLDELNRFQPAMLNGYASRLSWLASEKVAGRLSISPAIVTSSGETLTPTARKEIIAAFGCSLLNF